MSFHVSWNVDKYRDEHEQSDEHWELRKAFLERWKNNYPEERLVCLSRVFCNIELMGCRYPAEVMKEVAALSKEVAHSYRMQKRKRLQRTFVSASDAAEDRARGVKREGGIVIKDAPPPKLTRINFVKQGESEAIENTVNISQQSDEDVVDPKDVEIEPKVDSTISKGTDPSIYLNELLELDCINVIWFQDEMLNTSFGRLVLLIRPWMSKLSNIQASCQACNIPIKCIFENKSFKVILNNKLLAEACGLSKQLSKQLAETMAWDNLKTRVTIVLVKEQWIAHGDSCIGLNDVSGQSLQPGLVPQDNFGTPVESSVATRMMQMMGWRGGGLGADAQGIAEPIKPHLQMVDRAGLGSDISNIGTLKWLATNLMLRYESSSSLDVDLVFTSDFSKEERAALHQCAKTLGLASRSYGANEDRFIVVKKKLDPFAIVTAAILEGGNTEKYQVFIPVGVTHA